MRLLLTFTSLVLGLILTLQWVVLKPQTPEIHKPPNLGVADNASAIQLAELEFSLPPIDQLRDIEKRPLFIEGRRPLPDAPEAPPLPVAPPPPKIATPAPVLDLRGIILIGKERIAMLGRPVVKDGGNRLRTGQVINDWTVVAIEPDQVVLENGGERSVTSLRTFKAVPPPQQVPKPQAAPKPAGATPPKPGKRPPQRPPNPKTPSGIRMPSKQP